MNLNRLAVSMVAVLTTLFGACSIHPLPEDVTGVSTSVIVRKIRCEARDAVVKKALIYMKSKGFYLDKRQLETLDIKKTDPYLQLFAKTGIVFSFSLQGTENNGLTLTGDIINPLRHGVETLNGSLGGSLQRDNIRAFTVTDNFLELAQQIKDDYCNFASTQSNYAYPIVGRIGIDEMVDTFVDMTLFNGLGAKTDVATAVKRGPPTMADTITFTTTVSGGLTPKVVFTPVGKALQLLDATLAATANRTDKHSVVVGLGLPSAPIYPGSALNAFVTANARPRTGETAALQAVNQQIQRFEIAKPFIVAP